MSDAPAGGRWPRMPNICRAIHLPAQSGATVDARTHEPQIHPRMVSRPRRRHPPLPARLRRHDRPDRRLLGRDREGARKRRFRSCARWGTSSPTCSNTRSGPALSRTKHLPDDVPDEVKTRAAVGDHRPAERTVGMRRNLPRRGARVRGAGRGAFQARATTQLSGRTSQNKVVVFDRGRTRRRRVRARAHHGLHPGHAVRRRSHLRI